MKYISVVFGTYILDKVTILKWSYNSWPSDMTVIVIVGSLIILQPHNTQNTTAEPLYTRYA